MKNAIKAVGLHEQDHPEATQAQREIFHGKCTPEVNCKYLKWASDGKDKNLYICEKDGLMAPRNKAKELLFQKYPKALESFMDAFDNCIPDDVLKRSTKYITQSMNESGHGNL